MKTLSRPLGFVAVIVILAGAYFIGRGGRVPGAADGATVEAPDPGYSARDAEIIESGYDGRERYRLNARVIRQEVQSGNVDLEQLEMNYHPGAQGELPGAQPAPDAQETWHLVAERGQVRAGGDDVQLTGNVVVTGPAPASEQPLTLMTDSLRINTPTEFISTGAPVRVRMSGNEITAVGMEYDLKTGEVRLKSRVHASSAP